MTVISTTTDQAARTLTLVAQFDAAPSRVWDVWADPRKLERWWGPPTYPATFDRHEFTPGGQSRYHMTGPEGDRPRGWWGIDSLDEPHHITFRNGLADDSGEPVPGVEPMPTEVTLEPVDGGTRMTVVTRFLDDEQMRTMLDMQMAEGMAGAASQIDALLVPVTA